MIKLYSKINCGLRPFGCYGHHLFFLNIKISILLPDHESKKEFTCILKTINNTSDTSVVLLFRSSMTQFVCLFTGFPFVR